MDRFSSSSPKQSQLSVLKPLVKAPTLNIYNLSTAAEAPVDFVGSSYIPPTPAHMSRNKFAMGRKSSGGQAPRRHLASKSSSGRGGSTGRRVKVRDSTDSLSGFRRSSPKQSHLPVPESLVKAPAFPKQKSKISRQQHEAEKPQKAKANTSATATCGSSTDPTLSALPLLPVPVPGPVSADGVMSSPEALQPSS